MKFSIAAVFAAGALATPTLFGRQISEVTSDIAAISSATTDLDNSIKAFSGPNDVDSLTSASENVVSAINAGTATANAISPLSTDDAFSLIDPISSLIGVVKTTVSDLEAKKSLFQSNNLCGRVLEQVTAQQTAAQAFQNALIAKVPADIQPTAQGLAAQITEALAQAAASFKTCAGTTTTTTSSASSSTSSGVVTTITTTSGTAVITTTCTTTTTPVVPPAYPSSSPVVPPAYPSSSPVVPPAYPSSSPVVPPAYPSSSPVVPPAYPSSSPVVPPAYPSSSTPAGSVPPSYPSSSTPAGSVPPAYPSSSPAGSVPPSYPSSAPVVPPSYPSSTPVAPGTPTTAPGTSPTVVPANPNAGVKQAAGLSGVALAAVIAIAAF